MEFLFLSLFFLFIFLAIMTVVGVSRVRWIFLDVHGVCCR